jgi:hypothetical protein
MTDMRGFRAKLDKLLKDTAKPVAIFDLDGTVFDVTYRTMEIVRRFIGTPEIRSRFPEQAQAASKLRHQDFLYSLDATLNNVGIDRYSEHAARFLHAAETFWYKHFFTDELLAFDVPYSGSLECVRHVHREGAHVVYLSGRDIPNMSKGTIEALEKHGFPHTGHGITIFLKPAYGMNDLLFKDQTLATIRELGETVFTIDNEPANVGLFCDRFPRALNVHFHSLFAKHAEVRENGAAVVKSFAELGFH